MTAVSFPNEALGGRCGQASMDPALSHDAALAAPNPAESLLALNLVIERYQFMVI